MRYGVPRETIESDQEIPASPAHSLAPTSPGTGKFQLITTNYMFKMFASRVGNERN